MGRSEIGKLIVLLWEFFKVGTFTIGGGAAMIPQMQYLVVDKKGWLDQDEMIDCIALGQSLPGLIAINMATYIGYKQKKLLGAVFATLGVILPAFLVIILAVFVLDVFGENEYVRGAYTGVKAAVCGLILVTAIKLLKQMCGDAGRKADTKSAEKTSTDATERTSLKSAGKTGTYVESTSLKSAGKMSTDVESASLNVAGKASTDATEKRRANGGRDRQRVAFTILMAAASFVAVGVFGITAVLVILAGIAIGVIYGRISQNYSGTYRDQRDDFSKSDGEEGER